MSIVIDTSVVLAVAANEPTKPRLIEITRGDERALPTSHGMLAGPIIPLRLLEIPLEDAVRLAAELGLYAYDAYIIQCARLAGQPLLTLDGPLRQAACRAGVRALEMPT